MMASQRALCLLAFIAWGSELHRQFLCSCVGANRSSCIFRVLSVQLIRICVKYKTESD